jgi:hypothetical protein
MISCVMVGLESRWFDLWYARGAMPMCMVLGYRWDACEHSLVYATGVTPVIF